MTTKGPLTPQQVRILVAVGAGSGRALEIAARSGVKIEVIYPALARLVSRGMLAKDGGQPPGYHQTDEGARQLAASQAYMAKLAS